MKLVLILYSGSNRHLVPELLEHNGAEGYTELGPVHGAGASGRRAGTRAWPGDASVWFSIVPAAHAEALVTTLREEAGRLDHGERLHAAVLPTETFF